MTENELHFLIEHFYTYCSVKHLPKCAVKTEQIMFCQNWLNFSQTLVVTSTVCCSVKVCSHV
jgi:hypothetical protein